MRTGFRSRMIVSFFLLLSSFSIGRADPPDSTAYQPLYGTVEHVFGDYLRGQSMTPGQFVDTLAGNPDGRALMRRLAGVPHVRGITPATFNGALNVLAPDHPQARGLRTQVTDLVTRLRNPGTAGQRSPIALESAPGTRGGGGSSELCRAAARTSGGQEAHVERLLAAQEVRDDAAAETIAGGAPRTEGGERVVVQSPELAEALLEAAPPRGPEGGTELPQALGASETPPDGFREVAPGPQAGVEAQAEIPAAEVPRWHRVRNFLERSYQGWIAEPYQRQADRLNERWGSYLLYRAARKVARAGIGLGYQGGRIAILLGAAPFRLTWALMRLGYSGVHHLGLALEVRGLFLQQFYQTFWGLGPDGMPTARGKEVLKALRGVSDVLNALGLRTEVENECEGSAQVLNRNRLRYLRAHLATAEASIRFLRDHDLQAYLAARRAALQEQRFPNQVAVTEELLLTTLESLRTAGGSKREGETQEGDYHAVKGNYESARGEVERLRGEWNTKSRQVTEGETNRLALVVGSQRYQETTQQIEALRTQASVARADLMRAEEELRRARHELDVIAEAFAEAFEALPVIQSFASNYALPAPFTVSSEMEAHWREVNEDVMNYVYARSARSIFRRTIAAELGIPVLRIWKIGVRLWGWGRGKTETEASREVSTRLRRLQVTYLSRFLIYAVTLSGSPQAVTWVRAHGPETQARIEEIVQYANDEVGRRVQPYLSGSSSPARTDAGHVENPSPGSREGEDGSVPPDPPDPFTALEPENAADAGLGSRDQ